MLRQFSEDVSQPREWLDATGATGQHKTVAAYDFAHEPAAGTSHVTIPLFRGSVMVNANTGWVDHHDVAVISL